MSTAKPAKSGGKRRGGWGRWVHHDPEPVTTRRATPEDLERMDPDRPRNDTHYR